MKVMNSVRFLIAATAPLLLLTPAHALDAAAATRLAGQKACLACHAIDKKLVGPAYQEVAAKYKGMDAKQLAARIKAGGSGKWGAVPMPAQPTLSDAEAELLAAWVLAGAPAK